MKYSGILLFLFLAMVGFIGMAWFLIWPHDWGNDTAVTTVQAKPEAKPWHCQGGFKPAGVMSNAWDFDLLCN